MPKLLQITPDSGLYSCGKIAEEISRVAHEHGWDTYIAYGREHKDGVNSEIKVGNMYYVYEHYLESLLLDNEGLASRVPTKKLIKAIDKLKPDIIQIHILHDHWINYTVLFDYLNKIKIPLVWTFHDCWAITGHCFHFVTKKCVKWKERCFECPLIREYPKSYIDKSSRNYNVKKKLFSANKNLTVVSCSKWMDGIVRQSFLGDKNLRIINNGIDLSIFKPSKKVSNDRFTILAVSNVWNKEKGIYDIFKLRKELPDEYDIIIVGLSSTQLKNIPDGIIGIERTKNVKELVDLYSSSDVFINLTYADTFPTVNMEALACGTPVITYDTGGSPEVIDSQTGVVIRQGDINTVAKEVLKMKQTPLSSQACRKRAETCFDKNRCFARYLELYEELLKNA